MLKKHTSRRNPLLIQLQRRAECVILPCLTEAPKFPTWCNFAATVEPLYIN